MKTNTTNKKFSLSFSGDKLSNLIHGLNRDFESRVSDMMSGKHNFIFNNSSTHCNPIDIIRWLSETVPDSSPSLHIRNIILSTLNESEMSQGGSAAVCALTLSEILRQKTCDIDLCYDSIDKDLRAISMCSRRASSNDILEILSKLDFGSNSFCLAKRSIIKSTAVSSVQVLEASGFTRVERKTGYKFLVKTPDKFYSDSHARGSRKILCPKALVIDGFIENISEIDGLVQESFSSKNPLIIFCRGLSDEVQHTLAINYKNQILCVIPIVVPYDQIGANLINDISIVCKSDLVSSLKGELISTRKWSEISQIDSIDIKFDSEFVIIENNSSSFDVKVHKKNLRKKRLESTSSAETDIIDTRIACLSGDSVIISLGDDLGDLRGLYKDRIGSHIRAYKSGSKYGVISIKDANQFVSNQIIKRSLDKIQKVSESYISSSLIVGIRNAFICARHITQIGGIVYNDRKY